MFGISGKLSVGVESGDESQTIPMIEGSYLRIQPGTKYILYNESSSAGAIYFLRENHAST